MEAPEPPRLEQSVVRKPSNGNGSLHGSRLPPLAPNKSASVRDQLQREITATDTADELALWAHRSLSIKNTLTLGDAQAVEAAYVAKLKACPEEHGPPLDAELSAKQESSAPAATVAPFAKSVRKRSKAHLAFVASQRCVICKASPCDAHHLKIAQPRLLGRKVSDEFTVPLCRTHHQELHREGNEANWWANMQIAPLPIAKELWEASPIHVTRSPAGTSAPARV
jgi:hypothetical protein